MAINAAAPSAVSRDAKLWNIEQIKHPIYNRRPAGRRGPSVTIYQHAFAELRDVLRDPTKVVDRARRTRLRNTSKLHLAATNIYDSEEARCREVIPHLERLLDIDIVEKHKFQIGRSTVTPDAIAEEAIDGADTKAVIAFFEFKNESGGGDCEVQNALGLRKYLAQDRVRVPEFHL